MKIGIPTERRADEARVAGSPDMVRKLVAKGVEIAIESGAGAEACAAYCDCSLAAVRQNFAWSEVGAGRLDADDRAHVARLARRCLVERRQRK